MAMRFWGALTSKHRTLQTNRHLGMVLAFVAGAVNAGGFLAVQRYTSHMTGIVSSIADDLAIGNVLMAAAGVAALLAFVAGAMTTAILVNWGRRSNLHSEYAAPLFIEALLLLAFGLAGANLGSFATLLLPSTVLLLCFIMGLQNAMVTKLTQATIRTTHMTGVVTDLGIELGRLMYWNRTPLPQVPSLVLADRDKLFIHATVLTLFFTGAVAGALAFKRMGFSATISPSLALVVMALPPVLADLRQLRYR